MESGRVFSLLPVKQTPEHKEPAPPAQRRRFNGTMTPSFIHYFDLFLIERLLIVNLLFNKPEYDGRRVLTLSLGVK